MADIKLYGTLIRDDDTNTQKIVNANQVAGGYFVCASVPTSGTWQAGQLCYCTGDSKFYQYDGSSWQEKEFGTNATNDAYNLGYYDTITKNSDGTYTITRQTGYLVLDGVENKLDGKFDNPNNGEYPYNGCINYISKPSNTGTIADIISNTLKTVSADNLYVQNIYGIAVDTVGEIIIGLTTSISTLEDANAWLAQNPTSIQYKLAMATTEKVEANHYARYNERFILEHNKSEAERSANLTPYNLTTFPLNSSTRHLIAENLPSGTYTLSLNLNTYNAGSEYIVYINDNSIGTYSNGTSATFTSNNYINSIKIYSNDAKATSAKVMLNEGSVALPYQPYEGKVIHEKDISNIGNEYLPLSGGTMTGSLTIEQGNAINVSQYNDASGVSLMNNGNGTVTQFGSSSRPARMFSSVQPEWYKNGASQGVLAIKGDIPTKTSQLTNDSGYTTKKYVDSLSLGDLALPNYIENCDTTLIPGMYPINGNIVDSKAPTSNFWGTLIVLKDKISGVTQFAVDWLHSGAIYYRRAYNGTFNAWSKMMLKGDIPTKTSQLTNDSGFLTSHQDISGKLDKSGGTINAGGTKAPLILRGGAPNYREGLRIIPTDGWSTIVLGGNDIGESQGTSANSWSILNYNGSFFISKNGADGATIKLSNTDGTWKVNNNTIIHSGNISSQSVSYATTAGTANSVALKASSGGATKATMQYNTTEDCIEFIFA